MSYIHTKYLQRSIFIGGGWPSCPQCQAWGWLEFCWSVQHICLLRMGGGPYSMLQAPPRKYGFPLFGSALSSRYYTHPLDMPCGIDAAPRVLLLTVLVVVIEYKPPAVCLPFIARRKIPRVSTGVSRYSTLLSSPGITHPLVLPRDVDAAPHVLLLCCRSSTSSSPSPSAQALTFFLAQCAPEKEARTGCFCVFTPWFSVRTAIFN